MKQKVRMSYFDNAKFLLIFFVVLGHLLQSFISESYAVYEIYTFIYSFHMPAFILISGYFSKSFNKNPLNKIRNQFWNLIIPYLFFQWLYACYYYFIGVKNQLNFQIYLPQWSLWFLIALFFWYLSLFIFSKMPAVWGIPFSLFISLLSGYFSFLGKEFSLQRIFSFLPFFIVGYYFSPKWMNWFFNWKYRYFFSFGFLSNYLIIHKLGRIENQAFLASKPYEDFMEYPEQGILLRMLTLVLAFVGITSFFSLVPNVQRFYTHLGKYTVTAYLLQGFIIRFLREKWLDDTTFSWPLAGGLLVFSWLLTIVLTKPRLAIGYQKQLEKIQKILKGILFK